MHNNKHNVSVKSIYFSDLYCRLSLIKDLEYYYGECWMKYVTPSLATNNYVDRIHHIGKCQPELLIAHP